MRKNLIATKQKSFSSMHFPLNKSRIMFIMGSATLIKRPLRTSKTFFKAILTPIKPRKMTNPTIVTTTEASLLVVTAYPSPIAITRTTHHQRLLPTVVVPMISLKTAPAPPHVITQICLMFVTSAAFAKTAILNGLIAKCITQPQDHKQQGI